MVAVKALLLCGGVVVVAALGAVMASPPTPAADVKVSKQDQMQLPGLLFANRYTPEELAELAWSLRVSSYRVMPTIRLQVEEVPQQGLLVIGEAVLLDGLRLRFGDTMTVGDVFQRGLLWNNSSVDAKLRVVETGAVVSIPPETLLSVGSILARPRFFELTIDDCLADCPGENFYACCTYGDPPSCVCVPDGGVAPTSSDGGGPGSSYCSIEQGETRNRCVVECDEGYSACCKATDSGLPRSHCREDGSDFSGCTSGGEGASACSQGQTPHSPD
jgi:hypothetical protein